MTDPFRPLDRLRAVLEGPVAQVLVDNPARRNAFDLAMWRAIPPLFATLEDDARVRAIVLRGAGDLPFASGADISEFETVRATAAGGRAYEEANEAAFRAVAHCRKPVIAMMRGFCLGGGLGLAVSCDLRVAAQGCQFGVPAGRLGVGYPPEAMGYVVAAVGAMAAKDLFFTARRLDADEALRLGLVGKVVADAALEDEALGLAAAVAANAPLTLAAAKLAIAHAAGLPGAPARAEVEAAVAACFDSDDYREGRAAFLAKRPPVFTGR
ncbi:enoyl-CoA hydratase [Alsobacter sp. SYSU M60028]|uniref:Enoyl-CoA hydratase n=1 Tax=Alsobacter ponti TaxID=2962936 RepID=A0ABT1LJC5_9HYPH|nr:enoyl-CoA hydratase [Alsobacter ponti]MCP8940338.1 enoyl-CoA hydratase [Alsobacter ponti]